MGDVDLNNISIGARGGALQGSMKADSNGITWKRTGGGRTVEIPRDDIKGFTWSELPKSSSILVIHRKEGSPIPMVGFPKSSIPALQAAGLGTVDESPLPLTGHNWGNIKVDGSGLIFNISKKQSFILPLPDVAQVQQGRDEVILQFPTDDTTGTSRDDTLVEMTFHIPKDCKDFATNGSTQDPATEQDPAAILAPSKAFFDLVSSFTDAGAATGDAMATFDSVGVLVPRGRFDIEMFASSLKLVGQAQDFRVRYNSILRIFVLPKTNSSQTLVAICLDPPIRKGQTFYNTILCQFSNDDELTVELDMTEDALTAKNDKGAKLSKEMSGTAADVFARTLRGISGGKLTRPGAFRDNTGEGYAVRCSYKADDGFLYPLERAFFYVQKPPMMMPYEDIDCVEFLRQAAGITAAKTFDLAIRMKSTSGADHVFRSIPRSEWNNLFEWIQAKNLKIENFKEAQRGPGAGPSSYVDELGGGVDPGFAGLDARNGDGGSDNDDDDDEEDEDFAASESSSSDEEDSSGDEGDAKIVDEEDVPKPKKRKSGDDENGVASNKKQKMGESGGSDGKEKKPRKKKDKNAPKKALSAFMFFSSAKRDQVKADFPDISFGEVGKKLGELWKAATAEEKAEFEKKAEEDKVRYAKEMEDYKKKLENANDGGGGDNDEEDKEDVAGDDDDFKEI